MRLDAKSFTIIGVAPADVTIPGGAEYWRPLVFSPENLSDQQRGAQWVGGIARLKNGTSLEQAQAAMATVADRLAPDYSRAHKDRAIWAAPLQESAGRGIWPAHLFLLISVEPGVFLSPGIGAH